MTVTTDASGRRYVQAEVEVPGTPEEVWQAIATGPGISSWFVPTDLDGRVGGSSVSHFGPGMDAAATVTAWDPPRRFAAEGEGPGPNSPPLTTEWFVEARSGGTCVVRVVHSLFASGDDWDEQLNSFEAGWPAFFRILRLYLTHFRGQPCSAFQLMGVAPELRSGAWDALTGSLGLAGAAVGQRVNTSADAPPLAGLVERVGQGENPEELLIRLDEPAPGIVHLFALSMSSQVFLPVRFYLYGDRAAVAVARHAPVWNTWMSEHFRADGDASRVDSSRAG